jgi:hypothetical protein
MPRGRVDGELKRAQAVFVGVGGEERLAAHIGDGVG